ESVKLNLPPFVYIATKYPPNPVTKDFGENVLLPLVRGMTTKPEGGWAAQPLLTTGEDAWLEIGDLNGDIALDEKRGDTNAPLTVGVTLTRDAKNSDDKNKKDAPKQQRAAVLGDSDFLSNAYYEQLGNAGLGLNLAQWLSSRDAQLNIDVPKAPDTSLFL